MKPIYILAGAIVFIDILVMVTLIPQTSGAEANFCNDGNSICILIEELIPEPYKNSIQSYDALDIYTEDANNWTYMEFDVAGLPAGMTPQVLLSHIENIEENLRRNRAQTALVPLIYTASEPAPICMRDSDGSLNGLYSVNGQLQLVTDDPHCFGSCGIGDPCNQVDGGLHESAAFNS